MSSGAISAKNFPSGLFKQASELRRELPAAAGRFDNQQPAVAGMISTSNQFSGFEAVEKSRHVALVFARSVGKPSRRNLTCVRTAKQHGGFLRCVPKGRKQRSSAAGNLTLVRNSRYKVRSPPFPPRPTCWFVGSRSGTSGRGNLPSVAKARGCTSIFETAAVRRKPEGFIFGLGLGRGERE
jgi:hypothetical protein